MSNIDCRYHVISRHGLEGTLCDATRAGAFRAAETVPDESWPVAVYDSKAHRGQPELWNLLPNGTWCIVEHRKRGAVES
ncbi:hypothetical protein LCGC14_0728050 [marine sediment metagenome]|uniref:Uncharacterized protein n=1 Tax=marine sediment metagenome TaxID=412755 RepID=A0A0F9THM8_9ZZZZ